MATAEAYAVMTCVYLSGISRIRPRDVVTAGCCGWCPNEVLQEGKTKTQSTLPEARTLPPVRAFLCRLAVMSLWQMLSQEHPDHGDAYRLLLVIIVPYSLLAT